MANTAVEAMLGSTRSFVVAAAGCGKTELLGQLVAEQRSGRQLILTHTHAGVAAIKKRLARMRVPREKFHLDTIAGWCLRYGAAYPAISGYRPGAEADPDWSLTYPGAERVCRTSLGRRVLQESYSGVLVDEYQDCSLPQHALLRALSESIPCRGVGDPLQTIFGFRDDSVVPWATIKTEFDVVDDALTEPWRWRREGRNVALGDWLVEARKQLEETGRLIIADDAPITWVRQNPTMPPGQSWAAACRRRASTTETVVAILQWSWDCKDLAKRMGGRWPIVERFDDPDLLRFGTQIAEADGVTVVDALVKFMSKRMTGIGTALKTAVDAIKAGRGVARIKKNREHADRLSALASNPTPSNALAWLEGVLTHKEWWLYRRECAFQLRDALRHCTQNSFAQLPDMVAAARTRARHQGRHTHRRTIGTPLVVKGLEFDHAVLLWEPNPRPGQGSSYQSVQGLYVALTRASKSLTIVSKSRTLIPHGT